MFRRHVGLAVAVLSLIATACGASSPPPSTVASPTAAASTAAVATASPIASPQASAGFRVVGLDVTADPVETTAACPIEIAFHGRITVAGSGGKVSFKWVSSDGDVSSVETHTFTKPGSYDVSTGWTVDEATAPSGAGWSSIEIVDPVGPGSLAASPHASFTFTCDDSGFETIGFGIGGSDADCSIAKPARIFATTDKIRMVATWSPSLRAGTVVTFTLSRDGVVVDGYPVHVTYDVSTKCVHGNVSQGGKTALAGHYRLEVSPDTARAVSGEFDVK
jgi:hypothetical protein